MNKASVLITNTIASIDAELRDINLKIHDDPEIGRHEFHASKLLADYMESKGFKVKLGLPGIPTAFIAEYTRGSSGRRIGFCSEYDALPGIGHGCGHPLIAISGVACAIAIKSVLEEGILQEGSVVLFGTPAEETTHGGKISMIDQDVFQSRVDFCMMLHPYPYDINYCVMLARDEMKVEFFGKASHAGGAPWEGINAVDAIMQGWDNMSMLRQQTLPTNRIHGRLVEAGKSPNVIPDYASAEVVVRSVTHEELAELKGKVALCFEAAAVATGCKIKLTWNESGICKDVFMNDTLTNTYRHYMEQEGVPFMSRVDEEKVISGSTDFGNVSYVVPGTHPHFGIGINAPIHSVKFEKAARTKTAHQHTLRAAGALAKAGANVLLDDSLYCQMQADFRQGKQ
ncbi:hypothetical protein O0I10_010614 [Lichtheimia ornata]|uniref:Peptidase M20 domain-containing protein 2 n=1 Tax=Lichtheimia ornata TaxID=688661 RepID=A0AAD7XXK7_9FUNG|nr:uncharacterized protein O0I10_010614 [Lichtheimia ornata]KAJ8653692.1 hypothetical protein O0I10_010614 [Lichtheimia ornata]